MSEQDGRGRCRRKRSTKGRAAAVAIAMVVGTATSGAAQGGNREDVRSAATAREAAELEMLKRLLALYPGLLGKDATRTTSALPPEQAATPEAATNTKEAAVVMPEAATPGMAAGGEAQVEAVAVPVHRQVARFRGSGR